MDSIGAIKARFLVENIRPRYPIDLEWFSQQPELGLDKPVEIKPCDRLPKEVVATLVPHPVLRCDYIIYNPIHIKERIRFGIGHELAHLYLGHEGYSVGEDEDPVIRAEADDFSSEVLMPYFHIRAAASKLLHLNPLDLVRRLKSKKMFFTSTEACCRRLLEVGIVKGAYLLYDHKQVYYVYKSDGFNFRQVGQTINQVLLGMYLLLKPSDMDCLVFHNKNDTVYFHAKKYTSGKVFAAFVLDSDYMQEYDDLVQTILHMYSEEVV